MDLKFQDVHLYQVSGTQTLGYRYGYTCKISVAFGPSLSTHIRVHKASNPIVDSVFENLNHDVAFIDPRTRNWFYIRHDTWKAARNS